MKRLEFKHDSLVIAGFVLLAFLGCLAFLRVGGIYVSPDETANAFFARQFAESGSLASFDSLNVDLKDALHPRSAVSLAGRLVPGSFIGLPVLYGFLIAATGGWMLPFLTPLIAVVAVFAWYAVTRRLFDREIGLLSALLVAVHPAWWYYSARSLMHNVTFAAFLMFAAYFLVVRPSRGRNYADLDLVLAGVCTGLALFVRSSEVVWIALAALAAALAYRSKAIAWRQVALFAVSAVIALLPMAAINQATYGSPFATGYTAVVGNAEENGKENGEGAVETGNEAETPVSGIHYPVSKVFLPFGFSYKDIGKNVLAYGAGLFWWMTALILIGFPSAIPTRAVAKEQRRPRQAYLAFALAACAYLAVMYGSWTFFDNPDPTQITIGNSHVRYWIPVFVLLTPFAAHAIRWISRRALTETARRLAVAAIVLACVGLSVRATFFAPQDGLVYAAEGLEASRDIRARVLDLTEPDAVIVVDRGDKLFFPYRRVRYPLRDENTYALMPRIVLRAPLYYYGITLPQIDVDYLNDVKLGALGLQIEPVEAFGIETLYRITKR